MLNRIAVLASGRGSNLAALQDYLRGEAERAGRRDPAAEIVLVASDQAGARALELARGWGIAAHVLPRRGSDADVVNGLLRDHEADLVVLAGYLRLVPIEVVRAHRGRIVNVHPALLPAFGGPGMYGGRVHRAVLESGTRVTGATVHFVDEEYDRGATIAQWPVPVLAGDSAETLAARVLRVEHLLLPRAVDAVARGEVRLDDDGLIVRASNTTPTPNLAFTLRPQDDEELAQGIATMLAGD